MAQKGRRRHCVGWRQVDQPAAPTKLPALTETLRLPGKRLVVAVEQAA
jgi:hypothetical protein